MCRSLSCIGVDGNIPHSTIWLSGIALNLVYTTHLPLSSLSNFAANIVLFTILSVYDTINNQFAIFCHIWFIVIYGFFGFVFLLVA